MCPMLGAVEPRRAGVAFYSWSMAWDRTDNLWVKKQKRLAWIMAALTVALVLFVAFLIIMTSRMMDSLPGVSGQPRDVSRMFSAIRWSVIVPVALNGAIAIFSIRQALREWRILHRVPEFDAMVCPKCLSTMEHAGGDNVQCPKGHAVWPRTELRQFWEQFGLARMASWRTLAEQRRRHERRRWDVMGRHREWIQRHPVLAFTTVPLLMTLVYCGVLALVIPSYRLEALRFAPFMWIVATGAICLALGGKQRRGSEPHCARCEYERAVSQESATSLCPECGAAWNAPGGTVRGTISSKPPLLVAGAILLVLGMSGFQASQTGPISAWFASATPTSALIATLGSSTAGGAADWVELGNRTLAPEQRDRLAELLLDQRLEVSYFSATDGAAWIESQISAGTLPAELTERFFREALALRLDGPESARVGEECTVAVEGARRLSGKSSWRAEVAVAGFRTDDHETFHGMEGKWRMDTEFDTRIRGYLVRDRLVGIPQNDRVPPVAILKWDKPGRHTIHFTAFIVIRPSASGFGYTLDWKADDTPVLPGDEIRVIPVDLTHTIEVTQ
ncbi:MAG: hypothetical protein IT430_06695 [Phycisphaerales bacterium]|nr:hypothetical protein [Phycisphaerales bacterium]